MMGTNQIFGIPRDIAARSELWLKDFAGAGSTATSIYRFASIIRESGTGFTWQRDTIRGDSILVNFDMVMHVHMFSDFTGNNAIGVSLNSVNLSTSITALPTMEKLAITSTFTNAYTTLSVIIIVKAGDIIRIHSDGGATPNSQGQYRFTQVA